MEASSQSPVSDYAGAEGGGNGPPLDSLDASGNNSPEIMNCTTSICIPDLGMLSHQVTGIVMMKS